MKQWLLALLCCALLAISAAAADVSVVRMKSDCTVTENGSCQVVQTLELNAHTPQTEYTFPAAEDARAVTVTGADYEVHVRNGASYVTLRSQEGFAGDFTVVLSYEKASCVENTAEGQTLKLELVSGLWESSIDRLSFSVLLPKGVSGTPVFHSAYYGEDVDGLLTLHTENNLLSGMLRGGLLDRDAFSLTMAVPADTFAGIRNPAAVSGAAQWILTVLILLLIGLSVFYWYRFLRNPRLQSRARTLPPEGVTPAELSYLLCGERPKGILLVCWWASQGYLTMTQTGEKLLLHRQKTMGAELREEEQKLFVRLFGDSDTCTVGSARWRKFSALTATALGRFWNRRLYVRTSGNPNLLRLLAAVVSGLALLCTMNVMLPAMGLKWLILFAAFIVGAACGCVIWYACGKAAIKDWLWVALGGAALLLLYLLARFGGGLMTMLPTLALDLAVGYVTLHGGRLTAAGRETVEQAMGFRRYLLHPETHRPTTDPEAFYRLLLFAETVGAGKAFSAGAEIRTPCAWLTFRGKEPRNPVQFREQLRSLLDSADADT